MAGIIQGAMKIFGEAEKFTVADLLAKVYDPLATDTCKATRELIEELLGEKPSAKTLGRRLRPWTDRVLSGLILKASRGRTGTLEYHVRQA